MSADVPSQNQENHSNDSDLLEDNKQIFNEKEDESSSDASTKQENSNDGDSSQISDDLDLHANQSNKIADN